MWMAQAYYPVSGASTLDCREWGREREREREVEGEEREREGETEIGRGRVEREEEQCVLEVSYYMVACDATKRF